MPSSLSIALLTHCEWALSSAMATGRSATTVSSAAAVISCSGSAAGSHPNPRMAGTSRCSSAKRRIAARHSANERRPPSMTWKSSSLANLGCMCASMKPGSSRRPPRSTTWVRGPTNGSTSALLPTQTMRPSRTATASCRERAASTVYTTPLVRTRPAFMAGLCTRRPPRAPRRAWPSPRPAPRA